MVTVMEVTTMEKMEVTTMEEMEVTIMQEMEVTIMEEMGVGTMVTVIVAVLTPIMEVVVDQTQIMEIMATTMVAQILVNKSKCLALDSEISKYLTLMVRKAILKRLGSTDIL